jgi:excisionase family DNA binding protein
LTEPLVRGVRESARASGLPRDLLYRAIHDGRLRVLVSGRRILVPVGELAAFVEREANGGGRDDRAE